MKSEERRVNNTLHFSLFTLHSSLFSFFILFLLMETAQAQLKLTFPSKDGLTTTADWYPVNSDYPIILLCHQNRFSRGEYVETAPRLNKLGFNCMAIDQRVGEEVNGVRNETAAECKKHGRYETGDRGLDRGGTGQ